MMTEHNIPFENQHTSDLIIITGGSFQGKSLLAMKLAAKLNYSAVICTDLIRNILKVENPGESSYGTSSYRLTKEEWEQQKKNTCELLKNVLRIYDSRGEKIILEGVHFTEEFLAWGKRSNALLFCLDNPASLSYRVEKNRTDLQKY